MEVSSSTKKCYKIKVNDQVAHLPVFTHLCEIHTAERSAHSDAANEYRRKCGEEKKDRRRDNRGIAEPPQFLEEWLSDELLDARVEPESVSPLTMALAFGNRRIRCSSEYESPSSEAFLTFRTRQFLTIGSRTRARTGSDQARLTTFSLKPPTRAVPALSFCLARTHRMVRDIQATVTRPQQKGSLGRHCCVHFSTNFHYVSWPQAHSRPWANDKSTIHVVAFDLRTNSYSPFLWSHGLMSDKKVALFKQGSDGTHGQRVAFFNDSSAGPLNDRTAQSFPERLVPTHSQAERRKPFTRARVT